MQCSVSTRLYTSYACVPRFFALEENKNFSSKLELCLCVFTDLVLIVPIFLTFSYFSPSHLTLFLNHFILHLSLLRYLQHELVYEYKVHYILFAPA